MDRCGFLCHRTV